MVIAEKTFNRIIQCSGWIANKIYSEVNSLINVYLESR
jgi:hypothetical protein